MTLSISGESTKMFTDTRRWDKVAYLLPPRDRVSKNAVAIIASTAKSVG